jgi:hypothetical protein
MEFPCNLQRSGETGNGHSPGAFLLQHLVDVLSGLTSQRSLSLCCSVPPQHGSISGGGQGYPGDTFSTVAQHASQQYLGAVAPFVGDYWHSEGQRFRLSTS